MYCKKCGNQLPDNARFCSKCGTAITAPTANHTTVSGASRTVAVHQQPKAKKSFSGKFIAILMIIAVIGGSFFLLSSLGGNTINLKEMYEVSVQGIDGYGSAYLTINEDAAAEWLCDQAGINVEDVDLYELLSLRTFFSNYSFSAGMDYESYTKEIFGKSLSEEQVDKTISELVKKAEVLLYLDYELTPDTDLKNGDTVKITFTYDKEAAKDAGLRFKNTEWKYKVKDLTAVASIDLSSAITMSYTGFDGYGQLSYALDKSKLQSIGLTSDQAAAVERYVDIDCSQTTGLKNGDTLVFTIDAYTDYLASEAVVLEPLRFEKTVSGLEEARMIDPFEGLTISCSGISPYLTVKFNTTGCENIVQQLVSFEAPDGYARNGKSVTVTASIDPYLTEQYGVGLSVTTKELSFEPQAEFVSNLEGLDLSGMLKEMDDTLAAKSPSFNFVRIQRRDTAFLYLKEHKESELDRNTPYNFYVIMYEGESKYTNGCKSLAIIVSDLCKHPDGTFSYNTDIRWKYSYNSYNDLYEYLITENLNEYVVVNID